MTNVLITGGAGFIGRHLADHLTRQQDVTVTVIDNESLGSREHLDLEKVRFIRGDLRNRDELRSAMEGQDVVVHLAADTRVMDSIADPTHNFESNVIGSFNLLELCRELGVNRIVAASTGGAILGDVEPPVHEQMAPQPTSPYGASKLMLEGYLSAYSSSYGIRTCALRFSNIYGPRLLLRRRPRRGHLDRRPERRPGRLPARQRDPDHAQSAAGPHAQGDWPRARRGL